MPSASFTASRSYVRRSRRKGANRIPTPSRTTSGKETVLLFEIPTCTCIKWNWPKFVLHYTLCRFDTYYA